MIDDIKIKIYRADVNAWAIYVSICIAISLILIKISTIIVNSLSRWRCNNGKKRKKISSISTVIRKEPLINNKHLFFANHY